MDLLFFKLVFCTIMTKCQITYIIIIIHIPCLINSTSQGMNVIEASKHAVAMLGNLIIH